MTIYEFIGKYDGWIAFCIVLLAIALAARISNGD